MGLVDLSFSEQPLHVWVLDLARMSAVIDCPERFLSVAERAEVRRFRVERSRTIYSYAHMGLRYILSQYVDQPAPDICFARGVSGKPYLVGVDRSLAFNMAHTAGWAVVAVTGGVEVGVDIENPRPLSDCLALAKRFFSAEESELVNKVPICQRESLFYRHWVLKEAYLKLLGCGLPGGLDEFSVNVDVSHVGHRLIHSAWDDRAVYLDFLEVPSPCVAGVAWGCGESHDPILYDFCELWAEVVY